MVFPGLVMLTLYALMVSPGLGGTSDSIHYIWAAHTWRDTTSLLSPDGRPYRFWGPLYPLLIAAFYGSFGVRILHGVALLAHLSLWCRVGMWFLAPGPARWLPWFIALSSAILVPAKFIWSETVFGALAAAYMYAVVSWSRNKRAGRLGLATAVGFLLPLQRTMGFFLLAGVGVGLVLTGQWRGQWRGLLLHWAGCAAGGLAWNYYAEVLAGPPMYRSAQAAEALGAVADYGFVLARWFVPLVASWRDMAPGLWALVLMASLFFLFPKHQTRQHLTLSATDEPIAATLLRMRLVWWTVLVTVSALVMATRTGRAAVGPHDAERYCVVLVGPITLLALWQWSRFMNARSVAANNKRWLGYILLGGWLTSSAVRAGHNVMQLRQRPAIAWPSAGISSSIIGAKKTDFSFKQRSPPP